MEHFMSFQTNATPSSEGSENKTVFELLEKSLRDLKFGSIEIVVHDSKVVQIEKKEKTRFN